MTKTINTQKSLKKLKKYLINIRKYSQFIRSRPADKTFKTQVKRK